jgi:DNA-binding CsgD family transcriptional regulator
MLETQSPLVCPDAVCSLGLYAGRVTGSLVGRSQAMTAIAEGLEAARRSMTCLAIEGEPGIGKTRVLLAVEQLARESGFSVIAVTADEEIQGPFLVARSIFASSSAQAAAQSSASRQAVQRTIDALVNKDEPGFESLSPDRKLVRVFDLAAVALQTLSAERPLAILVDDMQWADEDSLRLLRYVARVDGSSPVFVVFAARASETAFVNEAVTLLADLDRMGMLRRLKLERLSQLDSKELLQQVLGAPISSESAAIMHAQAEGVPFVLAEQARAYRDAALIQQIDGVWTLARNAERLMPEAVQTLIRRRGAHLADSTKLAMGQAGILGRSFSLRDLREIKNKAGGEVVEIDDLAEALAPAVAAGLLIKLSAGSPADYSFSHEQIRQHAMESLTASQRRAIHAAIVEIFNAGEPSGECHAMLAQHALAAGQTELAARCSISAATAALQSHAGEEALRLVDVAHSIASAPQDRVALLRLRDDALDMLRRPTQRLEGLAELAALADALGDSHLTLDVLLRRAAAFRLSQEHDQAATLARRVRTLAAEAGDNQAELAACLELGQDLLRAEIGEGYVQAPSDADLEGAAEAYKRAAELAETLGDDSSLAAATRELGIINVSRVRIWFLERVAAGEHIEVLQRLTQGETLSDIFPSLPIAPVAGEAQECFRKALEIYERLGDRQGAMATVIAMAFLTWGPEIHLSGSAKRIEELRRLMMRMKSLTKESERALADAQMLFGAHVYSRAKLFPDAAIAKGKEAYNAARVLGDRSLEFALAGGIALSLAEIEDLGEAEQWLSRAAVIALEEPTALRARQLESWRGQLASIRGDAQRMSEHLSRAVQLAADQGRPAVQCEALALLAGESARLGRQLEDEDLLTQAERCARDAIALVQFLPGHPTWGAKAYAALARVELARSNLPKAAEAGRQAIAALDAAMKEDPFLDIFLPAAEAILRAGSSEEAALIQGRLQLTLALVAQRIIDEDVRVRWFRGPVGRELARLAGPAAALDGANQPPHQELGLSDRETTMLRLLTEGQTNREIAAQLGEDEASVVRLLNDLYLKIGASSRADATAVALMGKLV